MATAVSVSATNNADIDGMLVGVKWTGTITYSFPDSPSDYPNPYTYGNGEPTTSGFAQAPSQMQAAINYAVELILSYTNATISYAGTNGADIMVAQSPAANPTSYAYYPGNYAPGGDVWFGTAYDYSQASLGNYYFATALHEFGHAVGLKHSQETGGVANVAVPSVHDDSEYTVMSYRSYVGGPLTGYTNEAYGYPQTYMANDILALQTLYGVNYATHSENTVYTWSPTTGQEFINGVGQLAPGGGAGGSANRIYETIWDGGGVDTYDLSNYTTNLTINLNPGATSLFSSAQLAYLGDGHYAAGNVYNAYLYNNDVHSYIDNASGGAGNDKLIGNAIANVLNGGAGADSLDGGAGEDTASYSGSHAGVTVSLSTGTGSGGDAQGDTLVNIEDLFGSSFADTLTGNAGANVINGGGGADTMQGLGGNDTYYVDNSGDIVKELAGGGSDRVLTSVSYTLTAGQEIESLSTTNNAGTGAINLTGNAFAQTIVGNAGANVINGGGGADTMQGLGGNDTYYVDNSGDIVKELAGGGSDRVLTSVSYTLTAGQEIESLSTTNNAGTGAINLTGNAFAQTILGNAGANVIDGGAGNDILRGLGGADQFKFDTTLNASTNVDSIVDFTVASDKIDLAHTIFSALSVGTLSSSAFFIGAAAQNASEHVIYNASTGGLYYDPDGNGSAAATEFAKLSTGLALHNTDFIVV